MPILESFRARWADFKGDRAAKLRGETRVAPRGQRGRVYARVDETVVAGASGGAGAHVTAGPKVELEARVVRADGTVEILKLPAEVVRG